MSSLLRAPFVRQIGSYLAVAMVALALEHDVRPRARQGPDPVHKFGQVVDVFEDVPREDHVGGTMRRRQGT